jgi:hypothetical protein
MQALPARHSRSWRAVPAVRRCPLLLQRDDRFWENHPAAWGREPADGISQFASVLTAACYRSIYRKWAFMGAGVARPSYMYVKGLGPLM